MTLSTCRCNLYSAGETKSEQIIYLFFVLSQFNNRRKPISKAPYSSMQGESLVALLIVAKSGFDDFGAELHIVY